MREVSSFGKQNVSMQSYMKLAREILAFIRSLEDNVYNKYFSFISIWIKVFERLS